jgi:hypothetical protein
LTNPHRGIPEPLLGLHLSAALLFCGREERIGLRRDPTRALCTIKASGPIDRIYQPVTVGRGAGQGFSSRPAPNLAGLFGKVGNRLDAMRKILRALEI